MAEKRISPVHPGEVLLEEFLKPMGLSQNKLALNLGVHARKVNEIVLGKRRITAETALRLARYFGTSPQFWLGLQADYDLDVASDELGDASTARSACACRPKESGHGVTSLHSRARFDRFADISATSACPSRLSGAKAVERPSRCSGPRS
jgi:addiction module HigA family antidote